MISPMKYGLVLMDGTARPASMRPVKNGMMIVSVTADRGTSQTSQKLRECLRLVRTKWRIICLSMVGPYVSWLVVVYLTC